MNDHSIQLVRETFDLLEPIAPQAAALFYAKVFAADPSLTPLFKGDMASQGDRLMNALAMAVGRLDEPEVLVPVLRGLGQRHAGLGVRDEHYATFGVALLSTLRHDLGAAFTPEVEEAWAQVYGAAAGTMQEAARARV